MNICIATLPQVQLQGPDLAFWIIGQVTVVVLFATALVYGCVRSINKLFP